MAMHDPEFIVAERVYRRRAVSHIETMMRDNGFQQVDETWMSKDCCGEFDAVWARVTQHEDGGTRVTLTLADSDVQSIWPYMTLPGLVLAVAGFSLALTAWNRRWLAELLDWFREPSARHTETSKELQIQQARRRSMPDW